MAGSSSLEEVAYTPVMNQEDAVVKDGSARGVCQQFNRLQLVLCIVLIVSVTFQFIAIVTPGWSIYYTDSVSAYESVYYSTGCVKLEIKKETIEECKTLSHRDAFYQDYYASSEEGKPALGHRYNLVIQYQMNVQITWLLIVATLIFQGLKLFHPQEYFPRATIVNVVVLACSCPFMFQVLFKNFVDIDFRRKLSDTTSVKVGFPYSFFFYTLTFAMVLASLVLIIKQVLDQIREKDRIHAEIKVKFDRLKLEYDAEVDAFRRYRQRGHLRPDGGGSYRGDRKSRGDDRGSHSPRHSREIRDHDRDHHRYGDHSPRRPDDASRGRHSPRPRDRSPPRGHRNGDRSPRPHNRQGSPPSHDHKGHPPRNRSPRPDEREHHEIRRRSPPRNDSSSSSLPEGNDDRKSFRHSENHENPALVITPTIETTPNIIVEPRSSQAVVNDTTNGDINGTRSAKTEDIELNVANMV
ncbi:uncharacterized protein LOC132754930 [Ruditapes philippinarum]|uniref:uncharacterized protein LOC132754930 n=1 Tax=Ruditapes philippinarum TaxID=129788 RepID=UPI00295A7438|nr:uncharacterized protein LOC132754930 [Ruditapes philippinarum]